jgi:hypothetical protein
MIRKELLSPGSASRQANDLPAFFSSLIGNLIPPLALVLLLSQAVLAEKEVAAPVQPGNTVSGLEKRICSLTDAALRTEMDLERYYLQYRVVGEDEPHFRRVRYFLGQSSSAALNVASDSASLFAAVRMNRHPVSDSFWRRTAATALVSSLVGGASDGVELCSNAGVAWKNRASGLNPSAALYVVKEKLSTIDRLLAERERLLLACPDSKVREISTLEGLTLKSCRDWCAYEFADIYANVKSYQAGNNLYYVLDAAAFAMYAISARVQVHGVTHAGVNGTAALTGLVGSALFAQNYPVASVFTKLLYKRYFNKFARSLGQKLHNTREEASEQLYGLEALCENCPEETLERLGRLSERVPVYRLWAIRFEEYLDKETEHLRRMSRVALQSNISGPLIGGTSMAQSVLDLICSYRFRSGSRMLQRLTTAGCLNGSAASGATFLLTNEGVIEDWLYMRKQARRKTTPEDLIRQRIATLDELEKLLENQDD